MEFKKNYIQNYLAYLNDAEPEVINKNKNICLTVFVLLKLRAIAASKLDVAGSYMEQEEIIRDCIPLIKKLSVDS